jgi:D-alanyl-D-alanine carboxypeptidase
MGVRDHVRMRGLGAVLTITLLLSTACTAAARRDEPTVSPSPTFQVAPTPPRTTGIPTPDGKPLPSAEAAALQRVLDEAARQAVQLGEGAGAHGITAAVVSDRGTWTGAAGTDGRGARMTPAMVLATGGITNTFVAAEVLKLAAAGRVDLDAPVSSYLKHRLTANGATVRQVLGMHSGIAEVDAAGYQRINAAIKANCTRHWTMQETLGYYPAPRQPGIRSEYSDANYLLLGLMIEAVTGEPFARVLRRDLIGPAGLARVAVQDAERPPPPLAAPRLKPPPAQTGGYLPCRAEASAFAASAGIATDAASMARWGYLLYGGRLLRPADVREMTTEHTEFSDGTNYGLGTTLFSQIYGPSASFGHIGVSPGAESMLVVSPDERIAVAVLVADGNRYVGALMGRLYEVLEKFR